MVVWYSFYLRIAGDGLAAFEFGKVCLPDVLQQVKSTKWLQRRQSSLQNPTTPLATRKHVCKYSIMLLPGKSSSLAILKAMAIYSLLYSLFCASLLIKDE